MKNELNLLTVANLDTTLDKTFSARTEVLANNQTSCGGLIFV